MITRTILYGLVSISLLSISPNKAMAGPNVVVTLPYLGEIVRRVAPDAEVSVLVSPNADPHFISPTPALMARVGAADLFVENGLSLELWTGRLLDGAGNPQIRVGGEGHVFASAGVVPMDLPTELTRANGDLHPGGNPHIWFDPLNWGIAAHNIATGLAAIEPASAQAYFERVEALKSDVWSALFGDDLTAYMGGELLEGLARSGELIAFLERRGLIDRLGGWMGRAVSFSGRPVVFYHPSWSYFIDRFGLTLVGTIENRPGVSPSAAHRTELASEMESSGVSFVGVGSYYDPRLAEILAEQTGATVHILPTDVGSTPGADDLFGFMSALIDAVGR